MVNDIIFKLRCQYNAFDRYGNMTLSEDRLQEILDENQDEVMSECEGCAYSDELLDEICDLECQLEKYED